MTEYFNASIMAVNGRIASLATSMATLETATRASTECLQKSSEENRKLVVNLESKLDRLLDKFDKELPQSKVRAVTPMATATTSNTDGTMPGASS